MSVTNEITVQEAATQKGIFLDVRTYGERGFCSIAGSTHIPLDELEVRWEELPKGKPIIAYCHHGNRSLLAAAFLNSKGLSAKSLKGGIEEWSLKVDPEIPRY